VSEHVFLEPGEYLIELYQTDTQTTNCTNYHSQMITVHKSSLREPVLFPNPVQDVLSVTIPFEVEESNYTIYNASGQLMMTGNLAAGFNTLNLGRFEVGFYVIDCHIEGESHREKFVIK